ncbi:MAG: DNA polymerase III subunit delta [Paludibacteraceae bacterium]|nr:DNA polymerase III subunit delta [Paludibacteraceae bacterium]
MKHDELIKLLQSDQSAPVILLCGEESYYIDEATSYIETHTLDESARTFDQLVVYGKDLQGADISPIIMQARGFAMMGKKLIIVKEAQTIKKWDNLAPYMEHPQPSTILVICYKNGNPDKRLNVWKNFEKNGGIIMQSDKLKDYQVPDWIDKYLRDNRLAADPQVSHLLANYLGNDMTAIVGALRKLIDGRPEGVERIDTAMVERNVGISKDYNVFALQDALIHGDVFAANRIARYFASSKDHPMVKELGLLFTFFQNLMLYHYLSDHSDKSVAAALGINPYFVKDYTAAARRFNAMKTFHIIGYFRDIDARLKGIDNPSAKDADLWKELIYRILH